MGLSKYRWAKLCQNRHAWKAALIPLSLIAALSVSRWVIVKRSHPVPASSKPSSEPKRPYTEEPTPTRVVEQPAFLKEIHREFRSAATVVLDR